jgi:hypothetical protein
MGMTQKVIDDEEHGDWGAWSRRRRAARRIDGLRGTAGAGTGEPAGALLEQVGGAQGYADPVLIEHRAADGGGMRSLQNDVARCPGFGAEGEWREGCETCLRRTAPH